MRLGLSHGAPRAHDPRETERGKMSKFCRNCGNILEDNATFCNKCGTKADPVPGGATPYGYPSPASSGLSSEQAIFNMGILVAGILVIISTLLPYVTYSFWDKSQSISLLLGTGSDFRDGIFFVILAIGTVACTFMNQRLPALVLGVINFALCLFEMVNTANNLKESGFSSLVKVTNGLGFYLLLIASLGMAVLAVLSFVKNQKK